MTVYLIMQKTRLRFKFQQKVVFKITLHSWFKIFDSKETSLSSLESLSEFKKFCFSSCHDLHQTSFPGYCFADQQVRFCFSFLSYLLFIFAYQSFANQ
jgi:hypothetical protein